MSEIDDAFAAVTAAEDRLSAYRASRWTVTEKGALAALFAFWDVWWNQIGTLDPGDELARNGIASLITVEDGRLLDAAAEAVAPFEAQIRSALVEEKK
jgi:hypothetical protein